MKGIISEKQAFAAAKDFVNFFDGHMTKEGTKVVVVDGFGRRTVYDGLKAMLIDWKATLSEHTAQGGADFTSEIKMINQYAATHAA